MGSCHYNLMIASLLLGVLSASFSCTKKSSSHAATSIPAIRDREKGAVDSEGNQIEAQLGNRDFVPFCVAATDPEILRTIAALRESLGSSDCEGLQDRLLLATEIKLPNKKLLNIAPIAFAVNITTLDLSGNSIEDLKPLVLLRSLRNLELSENRIRDLSPLTKIDKLQMLGLTDNLVSDLTPLKELRELTLLKASRNLISNLAPLVALTKLQYLSIHTNPLLDLSSLSSMTQLRSLVLPNNLGIKDLTPLYAIKSLEHLDIKGTGVSDISFVQNFPHLKTLRLYGEKFTNLSALGNLGELTTLEINYAEPSAASGQLPPLDYSFLSTMTTLTSLDIVDLYSLVDFNFVGGLTNLKRLLISNRRVQDGQLLSRLTGLTFLSLDYITATPTFLNLMPELETLSLQGTRFTALPSLSNLTRLKKLVIGGFEFQMDLSAVAGLKSLEEIAINAIYLSDLNFLIGLSKLRVVEFWMVSIRDISPLKQLPEIKEIYFTDPYLQVDLQQIVGIKTLEKLAINNPGYNVPQGLEALLNLKELYLLRVNLSDCSPLSKLRNLQKLYVVNSGLTSLDCLAPLINLQSLSLEENPGLASIDPLESLTSLEYLDISLTKVSDLQVLRKLPMLASLYMEGSMATNLDPVKSLKRLKNTSFTQMALLRDSNSLSQLCAATDLNDGLKEACRSRLVP